MEPFRAIIVDDEWHARQNLKLLLEQHCPFVEVLGMADGLESGIELIGQHQPDLLFADIRMPSGAEGFEMVAALPDKNFQVVFVTAFKGFAVELFRSNQIDYLLKPIDIQELTRVGKKVYEDRIRYRDQPAMFENYVKGLDSLTDSLTRG